MTTHEPQKLLLFVYGTLKRGFTNHAKYCRGVRSVEVAAVVGRLYRLPVGYPMLVVPRQSVLEWGSINRSDDLESSTCRQTLPDAEWNSRLKQYGDDWQLVHGEILEFDASLAQLADLDQLEEYEPDGHRHYERVVVPARCHDGRVHTVWTYTAPRSGPTPNARLLDGSWP